jgi:hypothetical protein
MRFSATARFQAAEVAKSWNRSVDILPQNAKRVPAVVMFS